MRGTIGLVKSSMKITNIEMLNAYYGDLFRQLATIKRFLTTREWYFMHAKMRWRYKRSYRLLRKYERIQDSPLLNICVPELEQEKKKRARRSTQAKTTGGMGDPHHNQPETENIESTKAG